MKPPSFTLRSFIVVTITLAVAAAVLIPLIFRTGRTQRSIGCSMNLRALWAMSHLARTQGVQDSGGSDTFLVLQRGQDPARDYSWFICPHSGDPIEAGRTSYRGPAFDVAKMSAGDPVAADKEGNHGSVRGGTVLNKAGDCFEVTKTDPAWIRARGTTRE